MGPINVFQPSSSFVFTDKKTQSQSYILWHDLPTALFKKK